jgi:hypothetical protein
LFILFRLFYSFITILACIFDCMKWIFFNSNILIPIFISNFVWHK